MAEKAFVQKGEDPTFNQYVDFYKFLQVGRIARVDNERNIVDIQFSTNPVYSKNIPVTNPFFTGRAFVGGMPEVGSYVICGFIKLTNTVGTPVIVAYLDSEYYRSLNYIYSIGKTSDELKELTGVHEKIGYGVRRLKRRKLYPGDVGLESTQGSELLLDDGILLSDSKLDEIRISSAERTIIQNAVNNFQYTSGTRFLNGLVLRPNAPSIEPVILDNGQKMFVVTSDARSIDNNGQAFTEMRHEIRETANAVLDVVESYEDADFADDSAKGRLLISQILGTLVGNDKSDISRYGKVLRPQVFASEGNIPTPEDVICKPHEFFNLASAYQLKFDSGTKIDVDKEGHVFAYLTASSAAHPLGAGRSMEFASDGSLKFVIGKTNVGERSLELSTEGKVTMHFGFDSDTLTSCEWVLDRAMYMTINGTDKNGFARRDELFGHYYEKIHGDKTIDVDGSLNVIVKGKIQEDILGAKAENYVNDKMTNYGGDFQEIVTYQRQSKYGEGHVTDIAKTGDELNILEGDKTETLTLGNKEVTLIAGDSKETLTLGSHEVDLTAGDMKESLLKGNRETSITLGDHKIEVKTGDISQDVTLGDSTESVGTGNKTITVKLGDFEVKVTTGNVTIESTTGTVDVKASTQKVTVNGMLSVDVVSATKVNVKAPMVDIGQTPVKGGVVTGLPAPSHLDFICGTPLLTSQTIKAAL